MRAWVLAMLVAGCGRAGFDALASDAAPDTAAEDALARVPCAAVPGQLFCESFEEPTSPLSTVEGTVAIDSARVFRGAKSQHAQTTGTSEPAWMLGAVLPDVVAGDLHARWWVYVPASAPAGQLATVHMVDAAAPFHGVILGVQNDVVDVTCSEAGMTAISTVTLPRDRWVCLQLHVAIADGTGGMVEAAVDGAQVAELAGIDTLPANGYRNVHVGLYATALATGPEELWSDELAVGTLPIACD